MVVHFFMLVVLVNRLSFSHFLVIPCSLCHFNYAGVKYDVTIWRQYCLFTINTCEQQCAAYELGNHVICDIVVWQDMPLLS